MSYCNLSLEELRERAGRLVAELADCRICARDCRVNRLEGELGFCRGGRRAAVASYGRHFGEESVLVGSGGSGTIFFANCNLACQFCQNCDISQEDEGREVSPEELADIMLELAGKGCHNINFVSPSHYVPQIMEALVVAAARGLKLPLVYNTGGYDAVATLKRLDGVVDIYMPDLKFSDDAAGEKYSRAKRYFTVAREAVREMHRQVGDLEVDSRGIAVRGLLVRHLVMPGDLAGSRRVFEFLAREISPRTFVNIMDQYYPAYRAREYPELGRRVTGQEYRQALKWVREAGLTRLST
ncbi:MAG: radical SAM protein [Bacillota bacterium]|jgi:putative pyruvate formate lyase activating enzyme